MNELVLSSAMSTNVPALVSQAGERAGLRFLEFFTANIRNPNTRRVYARAASEFLTWCVDVGVPDLAAVAPLPGAHFTKPNIVIKPNANSRPTGDTTGYLANPKEV